ncbi:G-protein coupled receptor 35-like isoform X1 [Erpetoichthys calabaricus]|uniref:G protein-coupled receptor 35, tandem duplicate 1 n=2 Tax=Erpetoichthys calabaricus TaxID=27687 RepID=A0A8C4RWL6_ERPCA|nr:G-protein coupled receptor 35-like isoform X1 [Erpetoichthys calabaricus]
MCMNIKIFLAKKKMNTSNCNLTLTDGVHLFQMVFYIPVFILGLIFNISALVMFFWKQKNWTDTLIYLTNLSISDCILLFALPFKMHSYNTEWEATTLSFCQFLVSSYYVNMYVSILTVTVISIVRYVAIKFPFKAKTIQSRRKAIIVCILLWLTVCSLSAVFHLVDTPEKNTTQIKCFQKNTSKPLPLSFILVLEIVGFFGPFLIITFCSVQIICTLSKYNAMSSGRERTKSIRIIAANFVVFLVCFAPFHLGFLFKFLVETLRPNNCQLLQGFHTFVHIASCIANANCCLDVFCYYFILKDFRITSAAQSPISDKFNMKKFSFQSGVL